MGLVNATRIFGQVIAGEGVRPGTRPAADFLIIADAALPFALGGIAQGAEEAGIAVDIGERLVEHIAATDRQETAWEDLALVRDENESFAVAHARGPPRYAFGILVLGDTVLGLDALRDVAAIMHGLGGLDPEWSGLREF